MNKFIGIGRIVKEIEKRVTQSGKSVITFTIAIKRDKETSDFLNCVAWNSTADFLSQYVNKGDLISVDGKVQSRSYDKSDGNKAYVTEIITNAVSLLSKVQNKDKYELKEDEEIETKKFFDELNDLIKDDELPF